MLQRSASNRKWSCLPSILLIISSLLPACTTTDVSPVDWSFARADFEDEGRPLDELDGYIADFDVQAYITDFEIDVVQREFPIKAGMTIEQVEVLVAATAASWDYDTFKQNYNCGSGYHEIDDGSGWMYYWVNGKALLHVNITIQHGTVRSVWVMPGNREFVTSIYYRISGHGPRIGTNQLYPKRE